MAKTKQHVCLMCWNEELAASRAAVLKAKGFRVTVVDKPIAGWIGWFRELAPDAVLIDLDRLPSQGREVGVLLRGSKSTRHLPIIFLGGPEAKVARIQTELPDAGFGPWDGAAGLVQSEIATAAERPVPPPQMMERSGGADLARRLGIKAGLPVMLWGDAGFLCELLNDLPGELPKLATRRRAEHAQAAHLCLCVTRSILDMNAAFDFAAACPAGTTVWIMHPKQTSRLYTDFNQNDVRAMGLSKGWVDFKVCAIDSDWSGLRFALRKTPARR